MTIRTLTHSDQPRVMSRAEARAARAARVSTRTLVGRGLIPPMAGGADDDDDDDDDADDDDDTDDDDADDDKDKAKGKKKAPAKKPAKSDATDDDDDDDDDDDADDGETDAAKAKREAAEAKKRAAQAERRAKVAERKLARQAKQEAEDNGEFKDLYEQEKKRGDDLEKKLREGALERAVTAAARDAGARKPERILRLLDLSVDDVIDDEFDVDDRAIERAVRDLKKTDKYLFKGEDAQTADLNGARGKRNGRRGVDDGIRGAERIRNAYETSNT